jgi:hypothetical protein
MPVSGKPSIASLPQVLTWLLFLILGLGPVELSAAAAWARRQNLRSLIDSTWRSVSFGILTETGIDSLLFRQFAGS